METKSVTESKGSERTYSDSGVYAKLRRLKIQEEILTAAANKTSRKCNSDDSQSFLYVEELLDPRKFISEIKKAYAEIKNLFEDVKVITKDQEVLKNIDIDEIKRDIFELDKKIKSLKDFIYKEISVLKVAEKELLTQIHDNYDKHRHKLITRTYSKPQYNEVVPSPVRAIIKSPFKCVEVQRFQEFMKSSGNRYGGWDEYNHNMFVTIWNKHFYSIEILEKAILEDKSYASFQDQVVQKIFGIKPEDVKAHADWYFEYVHLKKCQEFALNKWRENKRKIKNLKRIAKGDGVQVRIDDDKLKQKLCQRNISNLKGHTSKGIDQVAVLSNMQELFRDLNLRDDDSSDVLDVKFILDNEKQSNRFERKCLSKEGNGIATGDTPTKYRHFQAGNDSPDGYNTGLNIDSIKKLKTPMWRIDLK